MLGKAGSTIRAKRSRNDSTIYHRKTEPIVERYAAKGLVVTIQAERSVDEVWRQVRSILERHTG